MTYLDDVNFTQPGLGGMFDELPLWSAHFGMLLLDRVPMRTGQVILDVGAGTGFLTVELAQRCGPSSHVIAVDPWHAAMDRLREKLAFLGLANVTLLAQDAATLDLPVESVDLVVSNLGINNFDDPLAVLRACARVIKPDGQLALTTNLSGHMAEFYDVFRATLAELGETVALDALAEHVAHRGTIASLTELLAQAGFEVVDVHTDAFRMRFADGTALLAHFFIRLGFMPGWKAVVDPARQLDTFAALERNLNAFAAERGELALTVPTACVVGRRRRRVDADPDEIGTDALPMSDIVGMVDSGTGDMAAEHDRHLEEAYAKERCSGPE